VRELSDVLFMKIQRIVCTRISWFSSEDASANGFGRLTVLLFST